MRKKLFLAVSILAANLFVFGQQNGEKYNYFVQQADSLYRLKDYKKAANMYSEAFKANGWKGTTNDRYNAACTWALASVPDSAFFQLERITKKANYSNYNHVSSDKDLVSLYNDSRWQPLLEAIKKNKDKIEEKYNRPVIAILDSVLIEDQKYRSQIMETQEKFGRDSKEMEVLWKTMAEKDSINLIKITSILDKYGWLGSDEVGPEGNMTLFLVIQHSDLKVQDKYLPMMKDAVSKGKANASSLALLEDRIALGHGKKQIYGSQIGQDSNSNQFYVLPLEDPDNVDARRASVGLPPLADYVIRWQIKWDVEQYKKDLPKLEKITR